jgi:WD40 repeat protein
MCLACALQVLLMVRQFDASKLRPRTLAYDPTGAFLLVGFTSGTVKLLDPTSLEDVANFKNGRDPITLVTFAPRGDFFATADAGEFERLSGCSVVGVYE